MIELRDVKKEYAKDDNQAQCKVIAQKNHRDPPEYLKKQAPSIRENGSLILCMFLYTLYSRPGFFAISLN